MKKEINLANRKRPKINNKKKYKSKSKMKKKCKYKIKIINSPQQKGKN